jgi:uncharacterized membrane protein YkvA (DUF1232 family)
MDGIQEFVLRGGQKVTAGAVFAFRDKLPLLGVKAAELDGLEGYPNLHEQITFLSRYVEDVLDGVHEAEDLTTVPEAVFALGYVLQDVDIIPDSVPGKGFCDDSAIVRAVLASHPQELQRYAAGSGTALPSLEP